jgi:DNA-binding MurR/RpiR family transcriptional regulator
MANKLSAKDRAAREATRRGEPQTFTQLSAILHERRDTLSKAHRKVADRVLTDPEATAFMTISELAAAADVNEATIVRFATSLGLSGYPGLLRLCREHLKEQVQLLERLDRLDSFSAGEHDPLERALAFDEANLRRTFSRIEPAQWETAVTALARAPRVHVIGFRVCFSVAYLLGYLLEMVRDDVNIPDNFAGRLPESLRRIRKGDCVVAISIHRYTADTVAAFEYAREEGATTIALTDNSASPLAHGATATFLVDTSGASIPRSVTAFTSLAQILVAAVAGELNTSARSALEVEEKLLDRLSVYLGRGEEAND